MKGLGSAILWFLCLPLVTMAQEAEVSASLPDDSRFMRRMNDTTTVKASDFANKNFDTNVFNTKLLNEKSSGLMRGANNFSFPNNSFAKQFQTGTFNGFGNNYSTFGNKNFSTNKAFNLNKQPPAAKVLDNKTDRDSGKKFAAQDWNKSYYHAAKAYQGPEMVELGSYSGTVVLQNKDDMKWGQETLTSEQIKEILNKSK